MLLTQIGWALLWLPGLALSRRMLPKQLRGGLLPALALGYAASFALLVPVSTACYLLRLPLWVMSAAMVLAVLAGGVDLWRGGALRVAPAALRREPAVGLLLLALHLWMHARAGGWLDGDATYHVARMRELLQHGFHNRDFYVTEPVFAHVYHTNLVYPVYAALTQLSSGDPLVSYFATEPWAALMLTAGHGWLAWALTGSRLACWLVAAVVTAAHAPMTYTLYPNTLAVGWWLPTVLGVALQVHRDPVSIPRAPALLAALVLTLSQVHGLYAVFAVVLLAPTLALRAVSRRLAGDAGRRRFALCLLALAAAAPMVVIARLGLGESPRPQPRPLPTVVAAYEAQLAKRPPVTERKSPSPDSPDRSEALLAGGGHLEKQLERRADGSYAFDADQMGGWAFVLLGLLAMGATAGRAERRSRTAWLAFSAAAATVAPILLWPPLTTLAVRASGISFAVARLAPVLSTLLFVALGSAVARLLEARRPLPEGWMQLGIVLAAILGSQLLGHAPRTFAEHWAMATAPASERLGMLHLHQARRRLLRTHVPAGELVLASQKVGRYLAMVHDVRLVAVDRGHGIVANLSARRRHVNIMVNRRTPWKVRQALLAHYGVRDVVYRDKRRKWYRWARSAGVELGHAGGLHLVRLRQR